MYRPAGKHCFVAMYGCVCDFLNRPRKLGNVLKKAINESGMHFEKVNWKRYDPQGVTLICYISESDVTISTYPEYKFAGLQIWSCGKKGDIRRLINILKKRLVPRTTVVEPIFEVHFDSPEGGKRG